MYPDFLVIGAEKAGTTWLYEILRQHPDVFMPDAKELHFFNKYDSNLIERDNFSRLGLEWYEAFFAHAQPSKIIGEATPMYLCDTDACQRIRATVPDVRLLISLRNPIDRAFSHYQMARSKGHVTVPLETLERSNYAFVLERGLYAEQIDRWLDHFPKKQIHIVIFEDMMAHPYEALAGIARHIGIEPEPFRQIKLTHRHNPATEYRSRAFYKWSTRTARLLRESPYTASLAKALKATGIYAKVKKLNKSGTTTQKITPEIRPHLQVYYADSVAQLTERFALDLRAWQDFR